METQNQMPSASNLAIATQLDNINFVASNLNQISYADVVINKDPRALKAIEDMERAISEMETRIKAAKAQYAEVKQRILDTMESQGIKKIENDHFFMTAKAAYTRTQFDGTAFRKDHPELAEPYIKTVDVKSALEIKLK